MTLLLSFHPFLVSFFSLHFFLLRTSYRQRCIFFVSNLAWLFVPLFDSWLVFFDRLFLFTGNECVFFRQVYLIISALEQMLSCLFLKFFLFFFFVTSFSLSFFFSFWIFSFRNVLIIIIIFQLIQKHPTNEDSTSKLDRSTGIDQSLDCSKFTPKSEQSPYASTLSRATTQCHAYTQCCVYTQRLHAPLRLHV